MRFAKMPDEPADAPTLPAPAAPVVSKGTESGRSSPESSSESGSSDSEEERATRLAELQEQVRPPRSPPAGSARRDAGTGPGRRQPRGPCWQWGGVQAPVGPGCVPLNTCPLGFAPLVCEVGLALPLSLDRGLTKA